MAALPTDPFDGKPLRMREIPEGLILYSVGEDGIDEGGMRGAENTGGDLAIRLPG